MTNPNEPALLAKGRAEQFYDEWALRYAERPIGERFIVPHSYEALFRLMDEYADSWRERRVQELEEALLKHGRHLVTCPHLSENMRSNSDCNCGWEKLLAKHSLTPELSSTQLDAKKEK